MYVFWVSLYTHLQHLFTHSYKITFWWFNNTCNIERGLMKEKFSFSPICFSGFLSYRCFHWKLIAVEVNWKNDVKRGKCESWWDRKKEVKTGKRKKEMALTDQFPICHKWFRRFWCDIQQFLKPTDNNVVCQKPLM
jgi:hypothetical protein